MDWKTLHRFSLSQLSPLEAEDMEHDGQLSVAEGLLAGP